ncbi:hypothetical protein EVC14_044 [Rhizobium phage RHph_I3_18]|nr:hypothetical protein EVC14_044 [Rhizobium phage RHph_I3_18]
MRFIAISLMAILDLVMAAVISLFLHEPGPAFLFIMAILWLFPLAIGIWALARYWLIYHLFLKRQMIRGFRAKFHEYRFPSANAYYDADQYLSGIMDDEEAPLKTKLKAAAFAGELAAYRSMHAFTAGIGSALAFQAAMESYKPERSYLLINEDPDNGSFFTVNPSRQ